MPPVRLAETATACASAVIIEASEAEISTSPPLTSTNSAPSMPAWTRLAILFSLHNPAPLPAKPPLVDAATATVVAATVASIVLLASAVRRTRRSARTLVRFASAGFVSSMYARTSIGVAPPYSLQPIRLRASEKPMATAGVVPPLTATDAAVALTRAVISDS